MAIHPKIFSDAALRHVREGSKLPPGQLRADELPPMAVSWASTQNLPVGSWKESRPVYQRALSPCLTHCPVGNDVEGFIRLMREGNDEAAARLLAAETPFPSTCGRVCYHPCESGCNRAELDKSVNIRAIERYLGDLSLFDSSDIWTPARESSGKTVAIVGAGPAGLSCAWASTLLGHEVTVLDKKPDPGGLLRYGIPPYRLPNEVLDREVNRLHSLGIQFVMGQERGRVHEIKELLNEYDAVFVASGASKSRQLDIGGESGQSQVTAVEFLTAIARGENIDPGAGCVIVGGGNSAIDAARCARRLGAEVAIVYRRGRADMPAYEAEIIDALEEGVVLHEHAIPHSVTVEHGRLSEVLCMNTRPGEPDESGRSQPVPVPDSRFKLPASLIINAIGEQVSSEDISNDPDLQNALSAVTDWGDSERDRLFAGGDFTNGERTVAHAIGSGKRAAMAIDKQLQGIACIGLDRFRVGGEPASLVGYLRDGDTEVLASGIHVVEYENLNPDYFPHLERNELSKLNSGIELSRFDEIEVGWQRDDALKEAARCFSCGKCTHCGLCQIFCPEGAVRVDPETGDYQVMDSICKGCGICAEECPRCALTMESVHEPRK
ncbi:glutamate synthase [NADPH] small chain [bacterium BMS3Bbin04]|nr:glutamate synthase [NADPH] small chain [bacterium BMS3Bbin04]